jgi:hypothetical protein
MSSLQDTSYEPQRQLRNDSSAIRIVKEFLGGSPSLGVQHPSQTSFKQPEEKSPGPAQHPQATVPCLTAIAWTASVASSGLAGIRKPPSFPSSGTACLLEHSRLLPTSPTGLPCQNSPAKQATTWRRFCNIFRGQVLLESPPQSLSKCPRSCRCLLSCSINQLL